MLRGIALIFCVAAALVLKVAGWCSYTCDLATPYRKKSLGIVSGERLGHLISPRREKDDPETCHGGF